MSPFVVVVVLLIAGHSCSATLRIIGGESAVIEKYPSIVQVESTTTGISWSQSCAGSILNSKYVLSAAQCFNGPLYSSSRRRIRAGSARRERNGIVIGLNQVLRHPTFSSSANEGDLVLVQLAASFIWSNSVQPVQIMPQDFELPEGLSVTLAGWGRTRKGLFGGSSSTLQETSVETVNHALCQETYNASRTISNTMICTGNPETSEAKDSCDGDEGGPVYYIDTNDELFLVGVISWQNSCGEGLPSVNTKVSAFTNWIVINAI